MAAALGAPREGPARWSGLVVCGRCGRRLMPASGGQDGCLRDTCGRGVMDDGAPPCVSLTGACLERVVVEQSRPGLPPAS
jgi:hypothetical protein